MSKNYKRENERYILSMGYAVFLFINKGIKNPPFQESIERGTLEIL